MLRSVLTSFGKWLFRFLKWFVLSSIVWFAVLAALFIFQQSHYEEGLSGVYTKGSFAIIYNGVPLRDVEILAGYLSANASRVEEDFGIEDMPPTVVYLYANEDPEFAASFGQGYRRDAQGYVDNLSLDTMHLQWAAPNEADKSALDRWGVISFVERAALHEYTHLVVHNVQYEAAHEGGFASTRVSWQRLCAYSAQSYCDLPPWLDEAVAEYETKIWRKNLLTEYPLHAATLTATTLTDQEVYVYGRLVSEYIVDTWGLEGMQHLLRAGGAIQTGLGIPEDQFNRDFRVYAEKRMKGLIEQYNLTGSIILD